MSKKCKHEWRGLSFNVVPKLISTIGGLAWDYNNADEVSTYGCHKCGAIKTKTHKRKD